MRNTNRDAIILNERIQSIWNRIYKVNESLTQYEQNQLILGFEDGINELFGFLGDIGAGVHKFAKKLTGGSKQAFDYVSKKGEEYYNKGKELAGKAWEAIKNFAKNVVETVKNGYNKAVESIASGYQSFKSFMVKAAQDAATAIQEAYKTMQDKGAALIESIKGIWSDILQEAGLAIEAIKEKFTSMKDGFKAWLEKSKVDLEKSAIDTGQSGIEILVKISDMAKQAWEKTTDVAATTAKVAFFLAVVPIVLLIEGCKKIPDAYKSSVEMINNFLEKEAAEIKARYDKGMATEKFKYIKTFENFKY